MKFEVVDLSKALGVTCGLSFVVVGLVVLPILRPRDLVMRSAIGMELNFSLAWKNFGGKRIARFEALKYAQRAFDTLSMTFHQRETFFLERLFASNGLRSESQNSRCSCFVCGSPRKRGPSFSFLGESISFPQGVKILCQAPDNLVNEEKMHFSYLSRYSSANCSK